MAHEKTLGRIIALPKYDDPRGNLTVADGQGGIPFPIARTYWITDVPGGESRGAHAHRQCREILVAVSGSFCITLDNGERRETYHLKRPWEALLVETERPKIIISNTKKLYLTCFQIINTILCNLM